MANPVELSWRQSERKLHFGGEKLGVPLKTPFLLSNIFKNVQLSTFLQKLLTFFKFQKIFLKTHGKNSKLKQNLKKTQAKIPKKLKNWQLQLS